MDMMVYDKFNKYDTAENLGMQESDNNRTKLLL